MAYFIKCINPRYLRDVLHVLREGKPHRLAHPDSIDRDQFATRRAARNAKQQAEKMFKAVTPTTKFKIERF
jgi:hypothetical protein